MNNDKFGNVVQVLGPVIDVEFSGDLPPINTALSISNNLIDEGKISPKTRNFIFYLILDIFKIKARNTKLIYFGYKKYINREYFVWMQ